MHQPSGDVTAGCVLVVDDADDLRQLVVMILRASGFEALQASTAFDALRAMDERSIDTVLVDLQLGSTSGLDLVKEMRARASGDGLRIVLMTASPEVDPRIVKDLGVAHVLAKPVTIDSIVAAVSPVPMRLAP